MVDRIRKLGPSPLKTGKARKVISDDGNSRKAQNENKLPEQDHG
jgi:hypothetical protein